MTSARAATRWQFGLAIALLLVLQFYVRPRLTDFRYAPDFVLIGLVLLALRFGAGAGAVVGFFADNLAVNAAFLAAAAWLRDLVVLLASGTSDGGLLPSLLITAPLRALTTAVAGSVLLLVFRSWFGVRLDQ
jgi:hypothetical protein